MKQPKIQASEPATPPSPRQYSLLDMFAAMTGAAMCLAVLTPLVRVIHGHGLMLPASLIAVSMTSGVVSYMLAARQRKRRLQDAGRKLGIGATGQLSWRYWPQAKCIAYLLLLLSAQIVLSLNLLRPSQPQLFLWPSLIHHLQLGAFCGWAILAVRVGSYPGALEVFEHGIEWQWGFYDWSRVKAATSGLQPGRAKIVLTPQTTSGGVTLMTQLPEELHARVVAAAMAL